MYFNLTIIITKTLIAKFYKIATEIQQLVLDGQIREAEEETKKLYPNLLESNPDLLFMLRCRHFVELVGQSMPPKSKPMEDSNDNPMDGETLHESICNGNAWRESHRYVDNDKAGSKGCDEEMEIAYSNGYQNGNNAGGDEMGKQIFWLGPIKYYLKLNFFNSNPNYLESFLYRR